MDDAITLSLSRHRIVALRPDGTSIDEPANIVVWRDERGRLALVAVAEDLTEVQQRIDACARNGTCAPLTLVRPGGDPRWDDVWRWPRPEPSPVSLPPDEALAVTPFARESWSPFLAEHLLAHWLVRLHPSTWRLFGFAPLLRVRLEDDFDDTEASEIADVLHALWPRRRLVLDREIAAKPVTEAAKQMQRAKLAELLLVGAVVVSALLLVRSSAPPWARIVPLVAAAGPILLVQRRAERLGQAVSREAPRRARSAGGAT